MRRKIRDSLLGVGLFLFCWMNLPKEFTNWLRSFATTPFYRSFSATSSDEMARLQLENQTLRAQIDHVYEKILYDQQVAEQLEFLQEAEKSSKRKTAHLRELLKAKLFSIPAQVAYRDPSSWSSSLWVNIGEEANRAMGKKVVAKNSPVLSEGALVGVVEHVGEKQSRIRLITDSGLTPSVRVARGALQNRELARQAHALLKQIEKREDVLPSSEKQMLMAQLHKLEKIGEGQWEDGYLAKGEIHGSSAPFWRSRSPLLRGIGFNFDYPDEEGSARDLRKGRDLHLLKEGDLLITSGLDGVFPPGLQVGTVTQVDPLKEGAYFYEIDVRPSVGNLNDLHTLFILPPISE